MTERSAASSDDLTLGDIEEQEMWEEHTRERVKQMQEASSAAQGRLWLLDKLVSVWCWWKFG